MLKKVYHGSRYGNIEIFKPNESTQPGKFVYATPFKELAGIFAVRLGSLRRSIIKENNKFYCVERLPNLLKNYPGKIYIYELDGKGFEFFDEHNWGQNEVRTSKEVMPLKTFEYENALAMLSEFHSQDKIKLFLYPDRPSNIPDDNSDLITSLIGIYNMNRAKYQHKVFNEFKGLYPDMADLADKIYEIIKDLNYAEVEDFREKIYNPKTQKIDHNFLASFKF